MRRELALISGLAIVVASGVGAAEGPTKLESFKARASYSLGYQMGQDLKRQGVRFDRKAVLAGLRDGQAGDKGRVADDEMKAILLRLKQSIVDKKVASRREKSMALIKAGTEFLEANKSRPGVQTTASGLQYKVIKEGSGARPGPSDTVRAHYKGTTVDGKEFHNTRRRDQPATFALDGIIKGWSEGMQRMRPGAIYELYIPYELAYGRRGPLAHRTLIFEVELLEVRPKASQPGAPSQTDRSDEDKP